MKRRYENTIHFQPADGMVCPACESRIGIEAREGSAHPILCRTCGAAGSWSEFGGAFGDAQWLFKPAQRALVDTFWGYCEDKHGENFSRRRDAAGNTVIKGAVMFPLTAAEKHNLDEVYKRLTRLGVKGRYT